MTRPPLLLALVLAGVLAAELWGAGLWQDPGAPTPAPPPRAPAGPITTAVPAAGRPSDPVPVLLARPLFTPGRRPPRVASPAAAETVPVALPRLTGVLVNGASRRAILVPAPGGKPVVVAEGARVGAFAVERIEPGQVALVGPGGTRVLRPSFDPLAPAAKPAAGPGPTSGLAGLPSPPAAAR